MKIAICSDVHLEFGDINLQNTEDAQVLILSGDIMVAKDLGAPDPHNFQKVLEALALQTSSSVVHSNSPMSSM